MRHYKFPTFPFVFLFISSFLLGCSTIQKNENLTASQLLEKGKNEVKINDLIEAKKIFQQLLEDYPDSPERVSALLYLADTFYRNDEFEEAKFHYQKFIELYPVNKIVDRAHFLKAMSEYKMMEIASRDQSHTKAALEGFEAVMANFPNSPYYAKAKNKKEECLSVLAKNAFEIGKFYYRTKSYHSAIGRLMNVTQQYPNQNFIDEAIFLIGESYYKEENYDKAKGSYLDLIDKYPKSAYAREARNRLKELR